MYEDVLSMSLPDIKKGYYYDRNKSVLVCGTCGMEFNAHEIYKVGDSYYRADKAAAMHVEKAHGGTLSVLCEGEKRETGLTENQKNLLSLIADGRTDREIADIMGVSASTVRHQKFVFRQKVRQAKMLIAVYELAVENACSGKAEDTPVPIHKNAKMIDERYNVTEAEREKILKTVFISLEPLKLKVFSAKEKKKLVALTKIAESFKAGRTYTEKEVNSILEDIFYDYVTLRRYLIEYGFIDRKRDGSEYWKSGE